MSPNQPVPSYPMIGFYSVRDNGFPQSPPTPATKGSACFDLRADLSEKCIQTWKNGNPDITKVVLVNVPTVFIKPGETALIPSGYIMDIPEGFYVRLQMRSSMAIKYGVIMPNAPAVIDSDYTDEVLIPIMNLTKQEVEIMHGQRIAQAELVPVFNYYPVILKKKPKKKGNRTGGLGSTGRS